MGSAVDLQSEYRLHIQKLLCQPVLQTSNIPDAAYSLSRGRYRKTQKTWAQRVYGRKEYG